MGPNSMAARSSHRTFLWVPCLARCLFCNFLVEFLFTFLSFSSMLLLSWAFLLSSLLCGWVSSGSNRLVSWPHWWIISFLRSSVTFAKRTFDPSPCLWMQLDQSCCLTFPCFLCVSDASIWGLCFPSSCWGVTQLALLSAQLSGFVASSFRVSVLSADLNALWTSKVLPLMILHWNAVHSFLALPGLQLTIQKYFSSTVLPKNSFYWFLVFDSESHNLALAGL